MTCQCHDPGVFGHCQPCPLAAPRPTRLLVDAGGNGFTLIITMREAP